jgi:hypothetical protein
MVLNVIRQQNTFESEGKMGEDTDTVGAITLVMYKTNLT